MRSEHLWLCVALCLALIPFGGVGADDEKPSNPREALHLTIHQEEAVWVEPILVTVRLESDQFYGLPSIVGESKVGKLRFEFDPAVELRPGAKPLPLEGLAPTTNAQCRDFDLFEWYQFPQAGGTWTVRAVFEHKERRLTSPEITVTIRNPDKDDPERQPVARIHHAPWSNYDTNAFCGDTFDLVQKWPDSCLAKYGHYWNGRYLQNKKEYDKAISSYRTVVEKYPDFTLADDAEYGIIECLYAQKKLEEAKKLNTALRQKLHGRAGKAGIKPGTSQTVVQRLAHGMTHRINRDLGLE